MNQPKAVRTIVDVIQEIIARGIESYDFHMNAAQEIGDGRGPVNEIR